MASKADWWPRMASKAGVAGQKWHLRLGVTKNDI